jgi:hypothetical protein
MTATATISLRTVNRPRGSRFTLARAARAQRGSQGRRAALQYFIDSLKCEAHLLFSKDGPLTPLNATTPACWRCSIDICWNRWGVGSSLFSGLQQGVAGGSLTLDPGHPRPDSSPNKGA